jgi:3-oxoacyl-[acyl-carrier protein] reductase
MFTLQDRVALVTGGSRGLGEEIVRTLAQLGADVAFTYLSQEDAARAVSEGVCGMGRRCLTFQADAKDFSRAAAVVEEVRQQWGRLDILVCNAGRGRLAPIWKMSEADWDEVIAASLKSAFNYIRAVAPLYIAQAAGKIVCIGSINGLRGRIGTASYNAAKAGLIGLVKTVAAELGRYNVNVNLVAPGFIETPGQINTPEIVRDLVLKECAIKRLGEPRDIAPVVAFLCTDAAQHITGEIIKVDAGQYL